MTQLTEKNSLKYLKREFKKKTQFENFPAANATTKTLSPASAINFI